MSGGVDSTVRTRGAGPGELGVELAQPECEGDRGVRDKRER